MIGSPKNIRKKIIPENAFEHKKKKPELSANRPWNNSAQEFFPSTSRIAVNGELKSDVYGKRKTSDKLRSSQNRKWADKNSSKQFSWIKLGAWIYWFPGGYNQSRQRINLFSWYLAERDLSHVYGIRDTFFAKFDGQTARTWRKFLAALLDTSHFLQFSRLFSKSILRLLAFASESIKNFALEKNFGLDLRAGLPRLLLYQPSRSRDFVDQIIDWHLICCTPKSPSSFSLIPCTGPRRGGGAGELALIFSGYVPLASQTPYPIIVRWSIIDPILVTFGQIFNFRDPNLVTFCFSELTHFLDWMKNTLLFICSTNILLHLLTVNMHMKNCLKIQKMCDPILVTVLNTRLDPSIEGLNGVVAFTVIG